MGTKTLAQRNREQVERIKESKNMNSRAKREEYSKLVPKPKIAVVKTAIENSNANSKLVQSYLEGADFEGSLYGEEEAGFEGAAGLERGGGGGGGSGEGRKEMKRTQMVQQLEAEHESAKAKIEQMKREFGL